MFTLPTHTSLRLRKPSKALAALIATVIHDEYVTLAVAFSTLISRRPDSFYVWYDLVTGDVEYIAGIRRDLGQQFEIEPGYALFDLHARKLTILLSSFARDAAMAAALEIARDAWLDDRKAECRRIARDTLTSGWLLFLGVIEKETNRGTA